MFLAPRNTKAPPSNSRQGFGFSELRGRDLNPRPSGYEPDELPGCSTPRRRPLLVSA